MLDGRRQISPFKSKVCLGVFNSSKYTTFQGNGLVVTVWNGTDGTFGQSWECFFQYFASVYGCCFECCLFLNFVFRHSLAKNKQALRSTGKCNIEQVHVVHDILQVLLLIVFFVDGVLHLFLGESHGNDWQLVVGIFCFLLAPDNIIFLQFPIAERNDDMVEFQTFAFVNREYPDAVDLIALDGFFMVGVVPFLQKISDA